MANDPLHRLDLTLPLELTEPVCTVLTAEAPWGWQEIETEVQTTLTIHLPGLDVAKNLLAKIKSKFPTIQGNITPEADRDWTSAWREFFTPIAVGDAFLVTAPWHEVSNPNPIRIIIEPKMAFGTGHHATTHLCLEALAGLVKSSQLSPADRFLDLGTGSGILGIAGAKLGLHGIGLDIDPVAVENALENSRINAVDERFPVAVGSVACLHPMERFQLILANILAAPLVDLAPTLKNLLAPGGRLVLSGLLTTQEFLVTTAYTRLGLPSPAALRRGEWSALVWDLSQPRNAG